MKSGRRAPTGAGREGREDREGPQARDSPKVPFDPLIGGARDVFLRRAFGGAFHVEPIAGDASTRRFYRLRIGRRTAILAVNPEPLDPSSPLYGNHRVLQAIGAPVPRLLARDDARGLLLMEDFGDRTLQRHLAGAGTAGAEAPSAGAAAILDEERRRLYREACDLIVLFHERAGKAIRPGDFATRNALDRERFLFELDHFHRHYIAGVRGETPAEGDEAVLRVFYAGLAEECDRMPRVYCHRDFMSRNLLVLPAPPRGRSRRRWRLGVIDYQDARMGPYTYDAASLLRDSSLDLDEGLVSDMVAYLAGRLGEGPEETRHDFDTMALERNIKELGTFGYMATVRGLRGYLDYVPRAVRSIRRTMTAATRYHYAYAVLDRYL